MDEDNEYIDYGFELDEVKNNLTECTSHLANYLNNGVLALFLGAGASRGVDLPNWPGLVYNCLQEVTIKNKTAILAQIKKGKDLSNEQLKDITQQIKDSINNKKKYLDLVKRNLYKGIDLDFNQASKDLLIAIAALTFGKVRGNIQNIVTYNFDSILEWYLSINGLNVNIFDKANLLTKKCDVNIIHTHGYLPYKKEHGKMSDSIIFTSEEFTDKWLQNSYLKEVMLDFFRLHVFLAVGLSPESIINDICPYLRKLNKDWYSVEHIYRNNPYGVAFLTTCTPTQERKLLENGIIPCKISNVKDIPTAIFNVAQKAATGKIFST